MKESRIKTFLLIASWSFFAVIVIGFYVSPGRYTNVTLGQLATAEPPAPLGHVRISNCVGGTRTGRHVVFLCPDPNRITVVFAFRNDTETDGAVYTGYCSGIVDYVVDGIPADHPYVLVIDCRPVTGR